MTRLEEIRNSLPKYRYLTPGIDKWREGDEYFAHGLPFNDSEENWLSASKYHIDSIQTVMFDALARRPYSQEYLDSMAFWIRLQEIAGIKIIPPEFTSSNVASEFGGEDRIHAEFEKGFGWLKENLP